MSIAPSSPSSPTPSPSEVPDIGGVPRFFGDLVNGIRIPLRSIGLILKSSALRKRVLAMSGIALGIQVALAIGLTFAAPAVVDALWSTSQADTSTLFLVLRFFLALAAYVILLAIGVLVLPGLALVPMTDPLSVAAEDAMGIARSGDGTILRTLKETGRAMANMAVRGTVFIAGHALLLSLLLVPLAGGIAWTVLSWVWTAVWTAMAYLDIPLARHLRSFGDAFRVFRRRKALFLGFGAMLTVILWVPVFNVLLVPLAIVASTMLLQALVAAGEL